MKVSQAIQGWTGAALIALTALVPFSLVAQSAFYVRQGAAGTNNGSDWNNAYTALPASLVRGATYYLADGTYPGYTFDDPESGTATITIKKALGTDHGTSVGWQSSYGDGQAVFNGGLNFARDYYIIDGQTRNETAWNDHASYGISAQQLLSAPGFFPPGGDHITIKHVSAGGVYSESYSPGMQEAVYLVGYSTPVHHITISRCFLHNSVKTICQLAGATDITIEYCWFGPGWGKEAIRGQVIAERVVVRHNVFRNSSQLDPEDPSSGCTAEIGVWSGNHDDWEVYGNLIYNTYEIWHSDAVILIGGNGVQWPGPGANNVKVYNNTIAGVRSGQARIQLNGLNNRAFNNLFYDNSQSSGVSATSVGNNLIATSNPFQNYSGQDFRLTSSSPARNQGSDQGVPYNIDRFGSVRGADGGWDIGAYEYAAGATDTTPPSVTGLAAGNLTTNSAVISFATSENARSGVEYGRTTSYGSSATNSTLINLHSFPLSGLDANSVYHYRVAVTDAAGNSTASGDYTFQTLALPAPDTNSPVITGVSAQSITANSATIAFATSELALGGVEYGVTASYGTMRTNSTLRTAHTLLLDGLAADVVYQFRVHAADAAGNHASVEGLSFRTLSADSVSPVVVLTAPASGAVVSNSVTLSATASDNVAVVGVAFLMDGVAVGAEVGSTPYTFQWDTLGVPNGTHTITARARDLAGNVAVSGDVIVTVSNPPRVLMQGLVGYWPLDDGRGTVAMDRSGLNRHGALLREGGWTTGLLRGGLTFGLVEATDRLDLGTFDVAGTGLSLAAWVNIDSLGSDSRIVSKAAGTALADAYWLLEVADVTPHRYGFRVHAGGSVMRLTGGTAMVGEWTHVVGVYDGTTMRLYQNGVQVGSSAKSGTLRTGTASVWVGNNPPDASRPFDGRIDDVRVYSRALSPTDVDALYRARTPQRPAGLATVGK